MKRLLVSLFVALSAGFSPVAQADTNQAITALWIGDSYTFGAGVAQPTLYGEGWLVSADLGWKPRLDAEGGTGFTNPGPPAYHFVALPNRLPGDAAISPPPQIVVIDAGRNDSGAQFSAEAAVVRAYMAQASRDFPRSRVLVITPWTMWGTSTDYLPLRCLLAEQARNYNFAYLDPIEEGWASTPTTYALMDKTTWHPSEAGYVYIADHLKIEIPAALAGKNQDFPPACAQVLSGAPRPGTLRAEDPRPAGDVITLLLLAS